GQQVLLPAPQAGAGPVPVRALDVCRPVLNDLGQQRFDDSRLGVVGVDEYRELRGVVADRHHGANGTPLSRVDTNASTTGFLAQRVAVGTQVIVDSGQQ